MSCEVVFILRPAELNLFYKPKLPLNIVSGTWCIIYNIIRPNSPEHRFTLTPEHRFTRTPEHRFTLPLNIVSPVMVHLRIDQPWE